ncbi:hypothetical protein HI914_04236 [Erysiphe necator]|nr:hypothetical protein HI914_04236 [Erysiphe necator]
MSNNSSNTTEQPISEPRIRSDQEGNHFDGNSSLGAEDEVGEAEDERIVSGLDIEDDEIEVTESRSELQIYILYMI